jgi:hypothetical protein
MDLANFVGLAGVIENTFRGGSFSSLEEKREDFSDFRYTVKL